MPMAAGAISQMANKTVSQLFGDGQLIGGLIGRKNNQRNLDNLQNPTYQPNKAISDYYSLALGKALENPYQSNYYNQAEKQANRGLATGIGALQDRRSAVGNIGALVEGRNDALEKAGVNAEGLQRQAFGQLGGATQMKAGDDRYAFDINKMMPFERKYSEFSGKLAANNQMINAGISNLFTGLTGGSAGAPNVGGYGGQQQIGGSNYLGGLMSMGGSGQSAPASALSGNYMNPY